jgi:DNA-directed RNA polymerase specialized sigma24 family protein
MKLIPKFKEGKSEWFTYLTRCLNNKILDLRSYGQGRRLGVDNKLVMASDLGCDDLEIFRDILLNARGGKGNEEDDN